MRKKRDKINNTTIMVIAGIVLTVYLSLRISTATNEADLGSSENFLRKFIAVLADIGTRPFHINLSAISFKSVIFVVIIGALVMFIYFGEKMSGKLKWDMYYEQKRKENLVKPKGLVVENDPSAALNINEMIGLDEVKAELDKVVAFYKGNKERKRMGLKTSEININMVFYGNPGTGKTVMARYFASELKRQKIARGNFVEADRSLLVASGPGQTAPLVHEVVESAIGGVLFIDEAYTLTSNRDEYGLEAVNTLLKLMEDYKEDLIVIVAGYDDLMRDFIDSNPGLQSRFTKHLQFRDYTASELFQIFQLLCNKRQYMCTDDANRALSEIFQEYVASKDVNFSNGRFVRNLFEEIIANQSIRTMQMHMKSRNDLITIIEEDVWA